MMFSDLSATTIIRATAPSRTKFSKKKKNKTRGENDEDDLLLFCLKVVTAHKRTDEEQAGNASEVGDYDLIS